MKHIKKLFFVPVGLPGMGKSTLAKHIKLAVEKNLSDKNVQTQKQMIYEDKENPVNVASCLE
jgi:tRNA uridine 5-carbamoylmethylation protein Kti12